MIYVLIVALILIVCVAAQRLIHVERRHLAQREIQRTRWRARFDEVRSEPPTSPVVVRSTNS